MCRNEECSLDTSEKGLTIVELLIVIVVIAILAVITLVAFNGVRERASYAKLATTVNSYSKALLFYGASNNNGYPGGYGSDVHCLGQPSDYPAVSGFPAGACAVYGSGGASYATQAAYDDLTSFMKSAMPDPKIDTVTFTRSNGFSWKFRGIYYEFNGTWVLMYLAVKGKTECPGNGKEEYSSDNSSTLCEYYMD